MVYFKYGSEAPSSGNSVGLRSTYNKGLLIKPSLITYKNLRFVLFDAPSDSNIELYVQELSEQNVVAVVRLCEPTYDKTILENIGIHVYDWPFADGESPPPAIIKSWLSLIEEVFGSINGAPLSKKKEKDFAKNKRKSKSLNSSEPQLSLSRSESAAQAQSPAIGVHCVAGLGRAPVLVAIALIEAGMSPLDSAIHVRANRRGAINARQLKCIENYKRYSKNKLCVIS